MELEYQLVKMGKRGRGNGLKLKELGGKYKIKIKKN